MKTEQNDLLELVGQTIYISGDSLKEIEKRVVLEVIGNQKGYFFKVPPYGSLTLTTLVPIEKCFLTRQGALENLKQRILEEIETLNNPPTPILPDKETTRPGLFTRLQTALSGEKP